MKKILSLIAALVTITGIASAQINIKKSNVGKPQEMTTLSMYWSWIYKVDASYYIVMKSSNQFDDSFWLKIGNTRQECLESISSLRDMMDTMDGSDRYDVDNGEGKTFSVTSPTEFGVKKLIFHGKYNAGTGYLLASNISKAKKWIEKNVR